MNAARELAKEVGVSRACDALDLPRASYYRRFKPTASTCKQSPKKQSPRALSKSERDAVRRTLYSERFMDKSPRQVYASLLDDGKYLCSVRTMYRILDEENASKERRNQLRRPNYTKPQLLAIGPNEVWSWDITKLLGPEKWTYYYLYVILDIYSRCAVGWMLAHRESADLARRLIRETIEKENVVQDQLIIHSDRGPSMTSHSVAQLLGALGVTKSHSRPHVSNDNPFSESQFKTMKYRPEFPARFGGYDDALSFCRRFFVWYNQEHYHSGIGLITPMSLHTGEAKQVIASRQVTLSSAYENHPERFVQGQPKPQPLPTAVWINPPSEDNVDETSVNQENVASENPLQKNRLLKTDSSQKPQASSIKTLTYHRPGYPSPSCVSAELNSVSPDNQQITPSGPNEQPPLNTGAMPKIISGVRGLAPDEAEISQTTEN